jgi:hypothetical protein
VAIAEKHQGLFVRYLPSLVSNYQTALLTTGPGSGLTGDAAANRDLADQIAELRAALSVAEQDAVRARERVAEVDADRWSAEVARESLAATEASLRETVAAMSETVRIAEAERAALQQLLDDHRQTRSLGSGTPGCAGVRTERTSGSAADQRYSRRRRAMRVNHPATGGR